MSFTDQPLMASSPSMEEEPLEPSFVLVPLNGNARRATQDPRNSRYQLPLRDGSWGVRLSFQEKQEFTLGRGSTDVYLPNARGADISSHQCSFTNNDNGAVLLSDHSSRRNTAPYASSQGSQVIPLDGETRSVLVARGINTHIAFGSDRYYQFEIQWECDGLYGFRKDESYLLGPSGRMKRYLFRDRLGGGSYGTVWSALDVTSGQLIAVKSFHHLMGKNTDFARREVENLITINRSKIPHSHIIEILGYYGGKPGDNFLEIMMPLKEGSLKSFVECKPDPDLSDEDIADDVLRQMLQALRCLSDHDLIHRDIKPDNILWEYKDGTKYHFRLGDFGLSHDPALAITIAGTEPFIAPEVLKKAKQTEKMDIWSLFATIVWVRDTENFRQLCYTKLPQEVQRWLSRISRRDEYATLRSMASMLPVERPTAKELLKTLSRIKKREAAAGDDPADQLASLARVMSLGDDAQAGPAAHPSPELTAQGYAPPPPPPAEYADEDATGSSPPGFQYYEPYSPYYADGGESSTAYNPIPAEFYPREPGHDQEDAWNADAYGAAQDPNERTALPAPQTARLHTKIVEGSAREGHKGKGKKRR